MGIGNGDWEWGLGMGIGNGDWEWGFGMEQCLGDIGSVNGGLPSPPPLPPLVRTKSARNLDWEWGSTLPCPCTQTLTS